MQMVRNQNLQRTEFIIADATAAIKLTLWDPPEQIKEDSTYTFKNLTIKIFDEKLLSTNPHTEILRTNTLDTVVDLPQDTKPIEGNITGVTICIFFYKLMPVLWHNCWSQWGTGLNQMYQLQQTTTHGFN